MYIYNYIYIYIYIYILTFFLASGSNILSGIYPGFFWYSGILSGLYSDIRSCIRGGILFGALLGVYSDILFDIFLTSALRDLNWECRISVDTAGPQLRVPDLSGARGWGPAGATEISRSRLGWLCTLAQGNAHAPAGFRPKEFGPNGFHAR